MASGGTGPTPGRPTTRRRWAAYLGAGAGLLGVLGGLIGAGTFVPYRGLMGAGYSGLAEFMTALSVAGLVASAVGLWAARGLLRHRVGAARELAVAGLATTALVALMGALYPVGLFLLAVVAPIWAVVLALLWTGAPGPRARTASSRAV